MDDKQILSRTLVFDFNQTPSTPELVAAKVTDLIMYGTVDNITVQGLRALHKGAIPTVPQYVATVLFTDGRADVAVAPHLDEALNHLRTALFDRPEVPFETLSVVVRLVANGVTRLTIDSSEADPDVTINAILSDPNYQ